MELVLQQAVDLELLAEESEWQRPMMGSLEMELLGHLQKLT
jgi:hypothetical protein